MGHRDGGEALGNQHKKGNTGRRYDFSHYNVLERQKTGLENHICGKTILVGIRLRIALS